MTDSKYVLMENKNPLEIKEELEFDQLLNNNDEENHLLGDSSSEKETHSNWEIIKNLLTSFIPATCGLLFVFLLETINIIFIGSLNSALLISSIGLGTLYVNATGYIPGVGLLGGIDTLCSQAFGKKNYKNLGNVASVGRISAVIFFFFFSIPMNFLCYYILFYIGIHESICEKASHFCHVMSISVFFNLQYQTSMKYIQSMNIFFPGSIITLITAILHPLWSYILIIVYELDVVGAGLSLGITQFLNFVLISLYIHIKNPCPESYFYIGKHTFKLSFIYEYLKKGLPAAIMYSADYIGFEILTFMASFLGEISLASNVCLFNFITIIFMLQLGLSMASTTLIGNSVGAENKENIRKYVKFSLIISITLSIITTLLVILYRSSIPSLYTGEPDVMKIFYNLLGIYLIFAVPDAVQINLHGIIKGLGKQKWASVACLLVLYPFNISLAYTLAFHFEYGVYGLWYSQTASIILLDILYIIIYIKADLHEIIKELKDRLEKMDKSSNSYKVSAA